MLKLKLQYFGQLMQRANSLEKTLMMEKIEGKRRREQQRMRWLDGITDSMTWIWANSGRYWRTEEPGVLQSMGLQRVQCDLGTDWQQVYVASLGYIILLKVVPCPLPSCFRTQSWFPQRGSEEVPATRKAVGVIPCEISRPENWGGGWWSESQHVWMPKNQEWWCVRTGLSSSREIYPSSPFLFYPGPQQIGWCPAPPPSSLGSTVCSTQFTSSNANHLQKHSDRHTQKQCFSFILINFFILALPGVLWDPTRDWTLVQGLNLLPHQ